MEQESTRNKKKIRLLRLWEILKRRTDENNPLSTYELLAILAAEGIEAERKTLYEDIDLLNEYGYEVMCDRKRRNYYYVADRSFDSSEIRMLCDAVNSANFITDKKSDELTAKLARLGGVSGIDNAMSVAVNYEKTKHANEQIWYSVEELSSATRKGKKIAFKYFDYNLNGKRVYRKGGADYIVNPLGLIYADENYYLVGYIFERPISFRVDRMESVRTLDEDINVVESLKDFDISEYRLKSFSMFGGKKLQVGFKAELKLIDVVFDKFGFDTKLFPVDENHFGFRQKIQVSPVFFSWVAQFGGALTITTPKSVIKDFCEFCHKLIKEYEE